MHVIVAHYKSITRLMVLTHVVSTVSFVVMATPIALAALGLAALVVIGLSSSAIGLHDRELCRGCNTRPAPAQQEEATIVTLWGVMGCLIGGGSLMVVMLAWPAWYPVAAFVALGMTYFLVRDTARLRFEVTNIRA